MQNVLISEELYIINFLNAAAYNQIVAKGWLEKEKSLRIEYS